MSKQRKRPRITCLVDQRPADPVAGLTLTELDPQIQATIQADYPNVTPQDFICSAHLFHYRLAKLDDLMAKDQQANRKLNHRLTQVFGQGDYQVVDVNRQLEGSLTVGQRIADAVARFGGSWTFIILFVGIMLAWMIINVVPLFSHHFDPYPFILLNLFLSMIAAIQAPLIMMSQKRAAEYDRLQAGNDFRVNAKSEAEIRVLHAKIDHLIQQANPNLLATQKLQTQMLGELQAQLNDLQRQHPH